MKILYLDLGAGAAGDMLAGALLDLLTASERAAFLLRLNAYLPEGVEVHAEGTAQCGVTGTRFRVTVHGEEEHEGGHDHAHHHGHRGPQELAALVDAMGLPTETAARVRAVYDAVASAESAVHGVPAADIHFHELGALDALADITAAALLTVALGAERVVASPVAVGSGTVRCAHGVLPVPAPATALLLRGVPCYAGEIPGELCTPTGAALVKAFAASFGPMPAMVPEAVGYGFGTKVFSEARPNCVRAIIGETAEELRRDVGGGPSGTPAPAGREETIIELACNLDDMTPEAVGFAMERLYDAGAVEVFTTSAGMKKNRPGAVLTALCRSDTRDAVLRAFFLHTTTLGVRTRELTRFALTREVGTVETVFGPVRRKLSRGFGVERCKWEYEDLVRIARERGMALDAVREALDRGCAE